MTVTFSEAVDTSNAGAGDLVTGDFNYTDVSGGGAGAISAMGADADGTDNVVTITVDTNFTAGDNNTDTLAAAAAQIYDLADNAADTSAVTVSIVDNTAPTILSKETADLDGDGTIDAVHITFDEAIDDSTVIANDWDVAGVTGEAFSSTTEWRHRRRRRHLHHLQRRRAGYRRYAGRDLHPGNPGRRRRQSAGFRRRCRLGRQRLGHGDL